MSEKVQNKSRTKNIIDHSSIIILKLYGRF